MDYRFSEEYTLFRSVARDFIQKEVAPRADKHDKEGMIHPELYVAFAKAGMMGLSIPEAYGGAGAGETGLCVLSEEMGRVCASTSTAIGAHSGIGSMPLLLEGTEEQKQKYLLPLAKGEKIGAFALTEPQAGSDASNMKTSAKKMGDHFLLNGSKLWITNGGVASTFTVFAMLERSPGIRGGMSAFIVEKDFEGFSLGTHEKKLGIRGSSTTELFFDDCRIPLENLLGKPGTGFRIALNVLDYGRITLAASCLGSAKTALELSIQFATTRVQFGKTIAENQIIQSYLAEMATRIQAMEHMVYHAAWLADNEQPFGTEAAMAKLFCSENSSWIINKALQIHGGMGYMADYPIERMHRDARIAEIFEGTNEIQKVVIAANLLKAKKRSGAS
ncbi:MAG TPA: acyl-CoA dehydrogenase [Cyanobacteria bacterium UBA8530]|nr:acyl-CoA dehydrogenase [Cyanobacteria bacterium UBA8530]